VKDCGKILSMKELFDVVDQGLKRCDESSAYDEIPQDNANQLSSVYLFHAVRLLCQINLQLVELRRLSGAEENDIDCKVICIK